MATLTHKALTEALSYDPETGLFRWLKRTSFRVRFGDVAGSSAHERGYVVIRIYGERFLAHRLAWFYVHCRWPAKQIDHKNCNPSDNRIANLREATQSENNANRRPRCRSGLKGVGFNEKLGRWNAQITVNGTVINLGLFDTKQDAQVAYMAAAHKAFGEFARTT